MLKLSVFAELMNTMNKEWRNVPKMMIDIAFQA